MSAHGIVDQIEADWREVIDNHDPGTDWGSDAKKLVDIALKGAKRARRHLLIQRMGLAFAEPERPQPVLPSRIQRRVGQPLPPGAVFVGKGSKWANPLRAVLVDGRWECVGAGLSGPLPWPCNTKARADWWAVEMFRQHIAPTLDLEPLRGKDLACWCAPDVSCHADVLLLLANGVGA